MVKPARSEQGTVQTVRSVCCSYNHHIIVANFLVVQLSSIKKMTQSLHTDQLLLLRENGEEPHFKNFLPCPECDFRLLPLSGGSSPFLSSPAFSDRLHPSHLKAQTGDASVRCQLSDRTIVSQSESRSHRGTGYKECRHGPGETAVYGKTVSGGTCTWLTMLLQSVSREHLCQSLL